MRMTLYSFLNLVDFHSDFIVVVLALVEVHVQGELSLIIVLNMVDFFRQQRVAAYTYSIDLIVEFTSLQLGVVIVCKYIYHFCCSDFRTMSLCLALLTAKLRPWMFVEFDILHDLTQVKS